MKKKRKGTSRKKRLEALDDIYKYIKTINERERLLNKKEKENELL